MTASDPADKIPTGSPVQWPESQLTANVESPAAISRSATTVGTLTIALAFDWTEPLLAFAHDPPETFALQRGESADAIAAIEAADLIEPSGLYSATLPRPRSSP